VRGLPAFTTESDLNSVCSPFGTVVKVLLLNTKQQAFVQMDSVEAAQNLVSRYATSAAYIRSKPIHFQYSNRSEVKTNSTSTTGGTGSGVDGGQSQTRTTLF